MAAAYTRLASHASGSPHPSAGWYEGDAALLSAQLARFLADADNGSAAVAAAAAAAGAADAGGGGGVTSGAPAAVRAIISPHAGFRYSGATAAFAYRRVAPLPRRVVVIGPSHHVALEDAIAVSRAHAFATPLGDLEADTAGAAALLAAARGAGVAAARWLTREEDEDEHSVEMQLPFLAHLARGSCAGGAAGATESAPARAAAVIAVLVGHLRPATTVALGGVLAPLLADASGTLLVISSDFCHYGGKFRFTPSFAPLFSPEETFRGIELLDREGMAAVERQSLRDWLGYLAATRNTVCGRHPIAALLAALEHLRRDGGGSSSDGSSVASGGGGNGGGGSGGACTVGATGVAGQLAPVLHEVSFVRYAQSAAAHGPGDTSVSYAAAIVTLA